MTDNYQNRATTEQNVYSVVYYALVGGMAVSSTLFVIGIVRALMHPAFYPLTRTWVREHYDASRIVHGLVHLDPMSLMIVATSLLILTPVARVAVSIYAFARDRDLKFVVVTGFVLLVIASTALAGYLGLR